MQFCGQFWLANNIPMDPDPYSFRNVGSRFVFISNAGSSYVSV